MPDGLLRALMVADAVAIQLGLACVLGALASQRWLRSATSAWAVRAARRTLVARRLGFIAGLCGVLAALWLEAAVAADLPLGEAAPAVAMLLQRTHFGHAWLIGLAAWLAIGMGSPASRRDASGTGRDFAAWIAVAIFAGTRSLVSHAASHGDASVAVAIDALHLALASLWVGIVFTGAGLVLPRDAAPASERADAIFWVARMSRTATWTLAGVLATGVFQVVRSLEPAPSLHAFLASEYGRALLAKLALVALAAGLGGVNRWRVLPALFERLAATRTTERANWRGRLMAILRIEALTLVLVIAAAAVLSGTAPPDG
jgi:putative copper resistance protein D